jgi:two-component system alkaline phosphatase synthesis response regulator PhoP
MAQRILLLDDSRAIARLVRTYLVQDGYDVLVAHDGETALHILRQERPDLLLLDMTPARRSGGGVAGMPILMFAVEVQDSERGGGSMLSAGKARTRPDEPGEVVARVRAVLHRLREMVPAHDSIQIEGLALDPGAHRAEVDGQPLHLTPTEFALLRTLAEQPGSALTRLELMAKGLGDSYQGRERTVDSHVKNLRRKLDAAAGKGYLVETVFGVGYRLAVGERA